MTLSRRAVLSNLSSQHISHAGLWHDRFLPRQPDRDERITDQEGTPQKKHLAEVANCATPTLYTHFYTRWQQALAARGADCRTATIQGRMVVGLGDESVLETAMTLHHTYGVPYIPGSALKGLAASYVRHFVDNPEWGQWNHDNKDKPVWHAGDAYHILFGNTEEAGYVTFFDAFYVPGSGHEGRALWPDVITVHHQDYYSDTGAPPADWDSPNPVPFLSATGSYLIALAGPDAWVVATFSILNAALKELGIGAKTSSGYGRMLLDDTQHADDLTQQGQHGQQKHAVDPYQQAVDVTRPWIGQKAILQYDQEIEGHGYIVRPKPGQAPNIAVFLSYDLAHGRMPQPGNDMSCIVRGVVEVEGIWYAQVEWPPKKEKSKKR
jgi:CRISPR-associated protein Cmr6